MKSILVCALAFGVMGSASAFAARGTATYACALNSSTGLEPIALQYEVQNTANGALKTVDLGSIRAGIQILNGKLQLRIGQRTVDTELLFSSPETVAEFDSTTNTAKISFTDSSGWYSLSCQK